MAASGQASVIITNWNLNVTSRYNYLAGAYDSIVPFSGSLTIAFPAYVYSTTDYGTTTITQFGALSETSFVSPVTQYIGSDPFGSGVAGAIAYTFPNVSDYTSVFTQQFAAQANAYTLNSGVNQFWSYHIELRAAKTAASLGGTGDYDFGYTSQSILDYLYDFKSGGSLASFNESFQLYDNSNNVSLDGFSWSGSATLQSISVIPEPSSYAIYISAFALFTTLNRRRKSKSK